MKRYLMCLFIAQKLFGGIVFSCGSSQPDHTPPPRRKRSRTPTEYKTYIFDDEERAEMRRVFALNKTENKLSKRGPIVIKVPQDLSKP